MAGVTDLPVYEPDFKSRAQFVPNDVVGEPDWRRDQARLRMTMLHVPPGERARGGLAIVWGTIAELEGPCGRELLGSRRPAVMELPDMWSGRVPVAMRHFPAEDFDVTWELLDSRCPWSETETGLVAMQGDWLPARRNLLREALGSRDAQIRHVGHDARIRARQLCERHGVEPPAWFGELPGLRMGCADDTFDALFRLYESRCLSVETVLDILDIDHEDLESAMREMFPKFGEKLSGDRTALVEQLVERLPPEKPVCARCGGTGSIGVISTYRCPRC